MFCWNSLVLGKPAELFTQSKIPRFWYQFSIYKVLKIYVIIFLRKVLYYVMKKDINQLDSYLFEKNWKFIKL